MALMAGARTAGLLLLLLAVVATAVGVTYAKYQSRRHFAELQQLRAERDAMVVRWGQLQLEQGMLTSHDRVEEIAIRQLRMTNPSLRTLVIVRP